VLSGANPLDPNPSPNRGLNAKQRAAKRRAQREAGIGTTFRDQLLMSVAATEAENALKAKMAPIIAAMQSDMDDMRVALKYLLFDLEATKREREEWKQRAEMLGWNDYSEDDDEEL
jgi:hypothetical protein